MNKLLPLIFSIPLLLHGDPEATKIANAYFKAGEFSRAIESYEGLLKKLDPGLKKEIINYNLASAYLADGNAKQAIDYFQPLLKSEIQLPKYLLERTHYNLILGHLHYVDHLLDHLEKDSPKTSVQEAGRNLMDAQEQYQAYIELKYPYFVSLEESPQEIVDLKNSLKAMHSKFKRIEHKVYLETLTFSEGLETLITKTSNRLLFLDAYLQSELKVDYKRYLLTQQYLAEKETISIWKRMQEIVEQNYDEAEKESHYKDKISRKQDKNFSKQSTHRVLFDQANNRHVTTLDYLKEYNLINSRIEQAKSKCDLLLMQLIEKEEDPLVFSLKEKIALLEKREMYQRKERFKEALDEELSHYNLVALGLTKNFDQKIEAYKSRSEDKKTYSELEKLQKVEELDVVHQLIGRLSKRLEEESEPNLEKFHHDYYLYEITKKKPLDYLLSAYDQLKQDRSISEIELKKIGYPFFAALNYFEIQHNFSYEESKNRRIEYALNHLPKVQDHLAQREINKALEVLEKLLVQWNFKQFVVSELKKSEEAYAPFLEQISNSEAEMERLKALNENILSYGDRLENKEEHQDTLNYLKENFSKIESSNALSLKDSFRNKTQKLLLKSGAQTLSRMGKELSEEKKTSKEVLIHGIEEEKLSLAFTTESDLGKISKEEEREAFHLIARDSQNYPLQAVSKFEDLFYEEEATQSADSGQSSKNGEALKYFKAGQVEAQKAQELLQEKDVNWQRVSAKQELVIEYWEKALKAFQGKDNNKDKNPNQNSLPSNGNQNQEPSSGEEGGDKEMGSVSQLENEGEGENKQNSLREILEKLQEMQSDDNIRPKQKQNPKKGLRPW